MKRLLVFAILFHVFFVSSTSKAACAEDGVVTKMVNDYVDLCEEFYKGDLDRTALQRLSNFFYENILKGCFGSVYDSAKGIGALAQIPKSVAKDGEEAMCRYALDAELAIKTLSPNEKFRAEAYAHHKDAIHNCRGGLQIIEERSKAFLALLKMLDDIFVNEASGFVCQPLKKTLEVVCPMLTGDKLVKYAKYSKLKLIEMLQHEGYFFTRLRKAKVSITTPEYEIISGITADGNETYKVIDVLNDRREYTTPIDEVNRMVEMNPRFKNVIQSIIKYSPSEKPTTLAIVDINDLGRANFFVKGYEGGDQYIQSVAKIIRENVGEDALVVKSKGDEFYVLFQGTSPEGVKLQLENITKAVSQSRDAESAFLAQRVSLRNNYQLINLAKNLNELPENLQKSLIGTNPGLTAENFTTSKPKILLQHLGAVSDMASYKASVSTGSATATVTDSLAEVSTRANSQLATNKGFYKQAVGQTSQKYNPAGATATGTRDLRAVPPVSLPVPAPKK